LEHVHLINQESLYHNIQYWYNSPVGCLVSEVEYGKLHEFLKEKFGYYLLQLGGPIQAKSSTASPIRHKIYFDIEQTSDYHDSSVIGQFDDLPFLPNSIDTVITQHILEFSKQPRKILNEIYHILIPGGHVTIIGFNPFSLWGFMHLYKGQSIPPWQGKFISVSRIRHWLIQIGFTIVKHKTFFFLPPLSNGDTMKKILFMEKIGQTLWPCCGAVYMIIAKKTVIALTPVKQKKRIFKRRVATAKTYAEPTIRNIK
jgi:SAM-dependent methyltransferase